MHRSVRVRALLVAVIGWLPLAVLSALHGDWLRPDRENSFLFDFGAHARFLIGAPLLILAEATCIPRLRAIAQHFRDAGLVADTDLANYEHAVASSRRLLHATGSTVLAFILSYALVFAILLQGLHGAIHFLPLWHGVLRRDAFALTPAGWWGLVVSLPILLAILLGWLWRVCVWTRFLWLMSRLELRLTPSHPDHAAGLLFAGTSLKAFVPVAFGLGVIAAGPVWNRIVNVGASILEFRFLIAGVVVFVLALFAGPLLVFARRLDEMEHHGILEYGAMASRMGTGLESKLLEARALDRRTLEAADLAATKDDLSATKDLNSIVSNVYAMRLVPLDKKNILLLIVVPLLPLVPLALLIAPPDEIMKKAMSLLF